MKKLILGVVMMIGTIGFATAQKVADTATKKSPKKMTLAKASGQAKKTTPANTVVAKPDPATAAKPATTLGVVLKKDGTRDKRYKNVPDTGKVALKKDGTPDKRHKPAKKN